MAIVVGNCVGKKRTLFDEIPGDQVFATTPPSSKKLRAAASPNSFHSFSAQAQLSHTPLRAQNLFAHQSHTPPDALLDHLRALFPEMDPKVLPKVDTTLKPRLVLLMTLSHRCIYFKKILILLSHGRRIACENVVIAWIVASVTCF